MPPSLNGCGDFEGPSSFDQARRKKWKTFDMVICIDGPGMDDDPVPLPGDHEPEIGEVLTLHGAPGP
jgi:hypothetical protein